MCNVFTYERSRLEGIPENGLMLTEFPITQKHIRVFSSCVRINATTELGPADGKNSPLFLGKFLHLRHRSS